MCRNNKIPVFSQSGVLSVNSCCWFERDYQARQKTLLGLPVHVHLHKRAHTGTHSPATWAFFQSQLASSWVSLCFSSCNPACTFLNHSNAFLEMHYRTQLFPQLWSLVQTEVLTRSNLSKSTTMIFRWFLKRSFSTRHSDCFTSLPKSLQPSFWIFMLAFTNQFFPCYPSCFVSSKCRLAYAGVLTANPTIHFCQHPWPPMQWFPRLTGSWSSPILQNFNCPPFDFQSHMSWWVPTSLASWYHQGQCYLCPQQAVGYL